MVNYDKENTKSFPVVNTGNEYHANPDMIENFSKNIQSDKNCRVKRQPFRPITAKKNHKKMDQNEHSPFNKKQKKLVRPEARLGMRKEPHTKIASTKAVNDCISSNETTELESHAVEVGKDETKAPSSRLKFDPNKPFRLESLYTGFTLPDLWMTGKPPSHLRDVYSIREYWPNIDELRVMYRLLETVEENGGIMEVCKNLNWDILSFCLM